MPALLLGAATTGAFFGGRFLRDTASVPRSAPSSPLAPSLDQVAENGAASGRKSGNGATGTAGNKNDNREATFETVYALVKEHYVDELPTDRILTQGAVRSLLQSLNDPNSQFLEPSQRTLLENEARGKFGGIGAVLSVQAQKQNGYTEYKLVVVAPLTGSPAEVAGLRTGDVITHVGGKWVLGYDPFLKASKLAQKAQTDDGGDDTNARQTYDAARARLRGGIGLFAAQMALKGDAPTLAAQKLQSAADATGGITLTIQRAGVSLTVSVPLQETVPPSGGVQSRTLAPGVAYIKIATLTTDTATAFQKAFAAVAHANGLVLDFRNNGGGLLSTAQAIDAALPLPSQNALPFGYETQGRTRQTVPLLPSPDAVPTKVKAALPLVVLTDGGTAGAAEALAAALADRHGATLMGGRTFGDASVQTLYPLPDGSAFTLTTGQWLSPHKQTWASGRGITPRVAGAVSGTSAQNDPLLKQALGLLHSPPPVRHAAAAAGRSGKKAKGAAGL